MRLQFDRPGRKQRLRAIEEVVEHLTDDDRLAVQRDPDARADHLDGQRVPFADGIVRLDERPFPRLVGVVVPQTAGPQADAARSHAITRAVRRFSTFPSAGGCCRPTPPVALEARALSRVIGAAMSGRRTTRSGRERARWALGYRSVSYPAFIVCHDCLNSSRNCRNSRFCLSGARSVSRSNQG